ncbi:hypothetical protein [Roseivivax sp. CAU 1761]
MRTIRKIFRIFGVAADAFEASFAAGVAFVSLNLAVYTRAMAREGWRQLAFPVADWADYEAVLLWLQATFFAGNGMLILKAWGTATLAGMFAAITVTAGYDAFARLRARLG